MMIIGHRGAAGLASENTIESIRRAVALGVDAIEIDVRCSSDNVPVVIHDKTLDRTTNRRGRVCEFTLANLREVTIGQSGWIPTLEEVLGEIGDRVLLNVELKEVEAAHPSGRVLQEAVIAQDISNERVLVSSFDMEALRRFRRVAASIPIAVLTEGMPPPSFWAMAAGLSAVAVNIDIASVNASFVQEAHGRGLQIMVYTVNTREDAARLQEMGVDGIFSDFPDRMHS